ncbi:MAG TPA: hypothetical protein VMI56_19600 [Reyranella sp.]|nr:hypothetical protein [Reyranella sp.]
MPRFVKGQPGGPGRPRGSRNRTTVLIQSLMPLGEAGVLKALAEAAADGDVAAARVLFARVWPRDRARERKCRSASVERQLEALGVEIGNPVQRR